MDALTRLKRIFPLLGLLALGPASVRAATPATPGNSPQSQPDNSKNNQDRSAPTADQQKMDASDRATTQSIRKAIMADKSLSTYAHNIKIITRNGKVTLRGPVRSNEEKSSVETKAAAVAGQENVTSMVDVVPSK